MQTGPRVLSIFSSPYWWAALACGASLGALIWVASERLTGHREPWDANHAYFLLALSCAGFVIGLLPGKNF